MSEAIAGDARISDDGDPLSLLRRRLIRIATASDMDDGDFTLAIQSLDAKMLMDQFPEWIALKDRRGRFVFANAAVLAVSGYGSIANLFGKTVFDVMAEDVAEERFLLEQRLMSLGCPNEREEIGCMPDGRQIWQYTTRTPLRDNDGQVVGLIVMSRDITERKRQEALRREEASVLEMVARGKPLQTILEAICRLVQNQLEGIQTSFLLLDADGICLRHGAAPDLPPAYTRIIDGIEIGPRAGSCGTAAWRRSPVMVRDIETDPLWYDFKDIALVFGLRSCWSTPIVSTDRDVLGTLALYSHTPREPTERELEIVCVATDLAGIAIERARNEERIRHMAHHDPLTGLPNRALFWPLFSRVLHEARRESRKATVAYIDLDNFKQINDVLGHAAGDEVLKTLATRLSKAVHASDLLVRLGGDEFAIVLSHAVLDEASLLDRLRDIRVNLSRSMDIDGVEVRATCSMGVAFFPKDGITPEELLACADRAMYEAKRHGRDLMEVARSAPPAAID